MLHAVTGLPPLSVRPARRLISAAIAALFLFASIDASYASTPWDSPSQPGSVSPDGMAAMLRLRIPSGGGSRIPSRPTLSLSAETVWRANALPVQYGRLRYAPHLEAGFTFGGAPMLRLGSIDMLNGQGPRLDAIENNERTPNWVWWVLGGAAAVTIVALVIASDEQPSGGDGALFY